MTDADLNFALICYDDYVSVYEYMRAIQRENATNNSDSATLTIVGLRKLRDFLPIALFSSDVHFGVMQKCEWRDLSLSDIYDSEGNIAGPPFYCFAADSDAKGLEALSLFCKKFDCGRVLPKQS
jgi:hypothetical protein